MAKSRIRPMLSEEPTPASASRVSILFPPLGKRVTDSQVSRTEKRRLKQRRKRQSLENEREESRLKLSKVYACDYSIALLHNVHSRTVRSISQFYACQQLNGIARITAPCELSLRQITWNAGTMETGGPDAGSRSRNHVLRNLTAFRIRKFPDEGGNGPKIEGFSTLILEHPGMG